LPLLLSPPPSPPLPLQRSLSPPLFSFLRRTDAARSGQRASEQRQQPATTAAPTNNKSAAALPLIGDNCSNSGEIPAATPPPSSSLLLDSGGRQPTTAGQQHQRAAVPRIAPPPPLSSPAKLEEFNNKASYFDKSSRVNILFLISTDFKILTDLFRSVQSITLGLWKEEN
ncbi:hypothetical protein AABB24_021410, partial [Solanum stoloniferum]